MTDIRFGRRPVPKTFGNTGRRSVEASRFGIAVGPGGFIDRMQFVQRRKPTRPDDRRKAHARHNRNSVQNHGRVHVKHVTPND